MNAIFEEAIDFPDGAGQIGWQDSDEDFIEDPRDTHPTFSFIGFSEGNLILEVEDKALPPLNPYLQPLTINHITLVEYHDGDGWNLIPAPEDGGYDETAERVIVPAASTPQCIAVKSINRVGNVRCEVFNPSGEKLPLGLTITPSFIQLPAGVREFCCFRPALTGCGVSLGEPYYGEVAFGISGGAKVSPEGRIEGVTPGLVTQTLTLTATISPGEPEQVATAAIVVPPLRVLYLPIILK